MKIAITGEKGFLGYHLTQYYKWIKKYEVISLGRNYLKKIDLLKDCDLLIHCAGVNRGNDIYEKNVSISQNLVDALKKNNISIDIKFTSSTQEDANNIYGKSKLKSKEILLSYCNQNKTKFTSYKIPNIFGPFGKPNYNSFINTFCYNLIHNIDSKYNSNSVDLCYVYDAIKSIDCNNDFKIHRATVEDVYLKLKKFHNDYSLGIIPNLMNDFDAKLFNTYRSFSKNIFTLEEHSDNRGNLVELLKGKGSETQLFFSNTKPNITRGDHFHFNKVERFCILSGKAKVSLRKIDDPEIIDYFVDGEDNTVIDMPILYTHNITNIGNQDLICAFWVNEIFDPQNPDTFFEKV